MNVFANGFVNVRLRYIGDQRRIFVEVFHSEAEQLRGCDLARHAVVGGEADLEGADDRGLFVLQFVFPDAVGDVVVDDFDGRAYSQVDVLRRDRDGDDERAVADPRFGEAGIDAVSQSHLVTHFQTEA